MPDLNGEGDLPLRILVVDDDQDNNAAMAMLIAFWGHECRCVSDGRSAVPLAEQFRPDVILTDLAMPEFTGLDLARGFRGDDRPVLVAISGLGGATHRQAAIDAGFDLYFVKPADPLAIQQILAEARTLKNVNGRTERLITTGEGLANDCDSLIADVRAMLA